jgi:hypothetical protein
MWGDNAGPVIGREGDEMSCVERQQDVCFLSRGGNEVQRIVKCTRPVNLARRSVA